MLRVAVVILAIGFLTGCPSPESSSGGAGNAKPESSGAEQAGSESGAAKSRQKRPEGSGSR